MVDTDYIVNMLLFEMNLTLFILSVLSSFQSSIHMQLPRLSVAHPLGLTSDV